MALDVVEGPLGGQRMCVCYSNSDIHRAVLQLAAAGVGAVGCNAGPILASISAMRGKSTSRVLLVTKMA
jgi:hypothetical protein